jgi:hypothetical protein
MVIKVKGLRIYIAELTKNSLNGTALQVDTLQVKNDTKSSAQTVAYDWLAVLLTNGWQSSHMLSLKPQPTLNAAMAGGNSSSPQ